MAKPQPSFAQLSQKDFDQRELPFLDRDEVDESKLTHFQRNWRERGYLKLPRLAPDVLMNAYCSLVEREARHRGPSPVGWNCPVPYMHFPEILDLTLYSPISEMLDHVFGLSLGLHLNQTGWETARAGWTQADALNPPWVCGHSAIVYIALEEIPWQAAPIYLPGSHRWPLLRGSLIQEWCLESGPDWPARSAELVSRAVTEEMSRRGSSNCVAQNAMRRGDVLIMHGRLIQSEPFVQRDRRALISHFSSVPHRVDFPVAQIYQRDHDFAVSGYRARSAGCYFPFNIPLSPEEK